MELIADGLLIAGAAGAALYCRALAKRLAKLKDLDSGLGAAIAALSRQVDELRGSLEQAKEMSGGHTQELAQLAARAEMAAGRLELLLASLHEGGRRKSVGEAASRRRSRLFDEDEDEDDAPSAPEPARDPEERARREADLRATIRRAFETDAEGDAARDGEARRA